MTARAELESLLELARLYRLEISFVDGLGHQRQATAETIIAVLRSLGASVEKPSDAPGALKEEISERAHRLVEPVVVGWGEDPPKTTIRLPRDTEDHPIQVEIFLENGGEFRGEHRWRDLMITQTFQAGTEAIQSRILELPQDLPPGYHRVRIQIGKTQGEILLIQSPKTAYQGEEDKRQWGVFLPLYSLHSKRSWGAGDFNDLESFMGWVESLGGNFVGTLPLFSAFLDDPYDPSPYRPVSRFFWNEFYVDPGRSPEWDQCSQARRVFESLEVQEAIQAQQSSPLVDYRQQMRLKRRVLEELCRCAPELSGQSPEWQEFAARGGQARHYAEFRAVLETRREPWQQWPCRLKEGTIVEGDFRPESRDYHLYVQWLAGRQLSSLLANSRDRGVGLYLDLPLGVHPDGFDVWSQPSTFASGVSGGAPPDAFFTNGQNWGFPPINPRQSRIERHEYVRNSLRHVLRLSNLVRIDHVMSLSRLYWVPDGTPADQGLYVHYPAEELFAIYCLESHRSNCTVIGEDLGTVSPEVRQRMGEQKILRMYVGEFEVFADKSPPVTEVPSDVIASLDTHDTPTFASFWLGLDIHEREKLGLLTGSQTLQEKQRRDELVLTMMKFFEIHGDREDDEVQFEAMSSWLRHLSRSEARFVMLNLEDLWLETLPQNIPGTGPEMPNWQRKARFSLEQFALDPELIDKLKETDSNRKNSPEGRSHG